MMQPLHTNLRETVVPDISQISADYDPLFRVKKSQRPLGFTPSTMELVKPGVVTQSTLSKIVRGPRQTSVDCEISQDMPGPLDIL